MTDSEKLKQSFNNFKKSVKTLQLSTITAEGKSNASYSPFVVDKQGTFISSLVNSPATRKTYWSIRKPVFY
ncbi:MAG: hypothetical protein L3J51_01335 [Cocleimonas sp.]|nr:hypothetical protein [Cocleimonas sp.]